MTSVLTVETTWVVYFNTIRIRYHLDNNINKQTMKKTNKSILPYQLIQVNSDAISSAEYYYTDYTLRVVFKNNSCYQYDDVPAFMFEGLRTSLSKGKFLNKYILRGKFNHIKIY